MLFYTALVGCILMTAPVTAVDRDSLNMRIELTEWSDDLVQNGDGQAPQFIIGGEIIVPGSRPYLVPIGGKFRCAGSLISPHAVMTTAHCVVSADEWYPTLWVEFHRHSWYNSTGVKRVYVNDRRQCDGDVVYHPEYNDFTVENDVAIIFLPDAINDITPVQLNEDASVPVSGAPLDIAGWGDTSTVDNYDWKAGPRAVTLEYVTNDACTKKPYRWREEVIKDSMMCAIENGKSTCYGDSGGPLVIGKPESEGGGPDSPVVQVGISSASIKWCIDSRFPNVFTRVSEVADWVKETVCERTGELCKSSKAGKTSKTKKKYSNCPKVPTYAPTVTAQPISPNPIYMPSATVQPVTPYPTSIWPTWMPTSSEAPMHHAKSNKLN